ncbi:methionine adenosyltransferase [Patescibacteria group bacterium]|nr:methionine adenosyltransferase [Patescibacteria group bacterium]MBU1966888.1 methionine adenosyltransferase [Patescibacteria group bacterium]MBU2543226.1 methionine adenosyltransferase [Patescibacteria group bacterium]
MFFTNHFTSESVCAGHPDKVADQISDAILDVALGQDSLSRVSVETLVTADRVVLAGEVTSTAKINYEQIARDQIKRLGYTDEIFGFTHHSPISVYIHQQAPEIAIGVDNDGAGDQGMMFGFATIETPELMPLPIILAHKLAWKIDQAREEKTLAYLRPDGKTQVTIRYEAGKPAGVETVVLAVPHSEDVSLEQVKSDLYQQVVVPVLAEYKFNLALKQLTVNGTGVWHIGGPASDTGMTGRKIIVDGYGGYAKVGGGAFSGKDPTKVDRSGAYGARYIAKNLVDRGLADQVEVGLAYCIGQPRPVMKTINTFGTAKVNDKAMAVFIDDFLDTSVQGIIKAFDLRKPIYLPTAVYGHFGRAEFPWEQVVK